MGLFKIAAAKDISLFKIAAATDIVIVNRSVCVSLHQVSSSHDVFKSKTEREGNRTSHK